MLRDLLSLRWWINLPGKIIENRGHILSILRKKLKREWKIWIEKNPKTIARRRWNIDRGKHSLPSNFPIDSDSLVFDVGGYRGNWSSQIYEKYQPELWIFEPVENYYNTISEKFTETPNVQTFNHGLYNETTEKVLYTNQRRSTIVENESATDQQKVRLVDIDEFLKEHDIDNIDLMKINIEGSEFELLNRIIDKNHIKKIKHLVVQFHNFPYISNPVQRKRDIESRLKQTHDLIYKYEFIWQRWDRK